MSKTKRISYKGIPAKNRAQVAKIRKFRSLDISLLDGKPDTPQKIWNGLNEHWAKQREEKKRGRGKKSGGAAGQYPNQSNRGFESSAGKADCGL